MTDEQTETAALSLAKNLDYPWSYMTPKGREEMRQMARDAFAAATAPLLAKIADLEAKLAQRVPDGFELVAVKGLGPLVSALERADRKGYMPFALEEEWGGFDYQNVAAAPAAPEQQEPKCCSLCGSDEPFSGSCGGGRDNPSALCYQASNAQQAELPPGWKTVVVPEEVGHEPDWEDVRYQAETATGIELPRAVFSIVIREVRRWLAAQQAEPPPWNALVSDREYLRLFEEARHGSTGAFGVLRGIRACIAAYEAANSPASGISKDSK